MDTTTTSNNYDHQMYDNNSSSIRDYIRHSGDLYGFATCTICKNTFTNQQFMWHTCVGRCRHCKKKHILPSNGITKNCKLVKRFVCEGFCKRSFQYKVQLDKHICEKLQCDKCGKTYVRDTPYQKHILKCSGDRNMLIHVGGGA